MQKIVDVFGKTSNQEKSIQDTWYGRVFVSENNSFIGVTDTKEELLFGTLTKDSIQMTKCRNDEVEDYDGIKEKRSFIGSIKTYIDGSKEENGIFQITCIPSEITREATELEHTYLETKIERAIHSLNEEGTILYQDFLQVQQSQKNNKTV